MRRLLLAALGSALVAGALPAGAVPVPVVASANVELLATHPEATGAISTAFAVSKPLMFVNTLNGILAYDIANPEAPMPLGALPLPHFENEGMALGERDGKIFVLVGIDTHAVAPTAPSNQLVTPLSPNGVYVVEVTDPKNPVVRGFTSTSTSTHTIQCTSPTCEFAYTSGAYNPEFTIVDLRNLAAPKTVKNVKSVVAGGSGSGHQWTPDDSGLLWVAGWGGTAAYDVTDPVNPKVVASTDKNGTSAPYNDFIQHNVYRPGAKAFTQVRDEATGRLVSGSIQTASVFDGNVALVTEEDYDNPDCQAQLDTDAPEGGFSTWYVPYLDVDQYKKDNAQGKVNMGKITPLDNWNTELAYAPGTPTPAGALCSAHYFTYHQSGFIAQGWYQQGTRFLDLRNPRDIKQVAYFAAGASEVWNAYFVPEYKGGKQTGQMTNVVYTNDVIRGVDVLKVTFPTASAEDTAPVTAPILPQWLEPATDTASARASRDIHS